MEFLQKEILSRERAMQLIKPGNSKDSQSYHKPFKRPDTPIEMKQKKHHMPSVKEYRTVFSVTVQHTKQNCVQELILLHEKEN